MAKKSNAKKSTAKKSAKTPSEVWVVSHDCKLAGCSRMHKVCIPEYPDDDAWYSYTCPTTKKKTGFKFGDVSYGPPESKCPPGIPRAKRVKPGSI
jgi:hypothetical protein